MIDPCLVFTLELDEAGGARQLEGLESPGRQSLKNHWIHLDYSQGSVDRLLLELGLNELTVESLTREDTRPRVSVTPSGTLLVLRAINMNPAADPEDMVSLRIWLEPDRLITVRQRRLLSVQDVKGELLAGQGPADVIGVVFDLIRKIANRIADFVEGVEDRLSVLEAMFLEEPDYRHRPATAALRREVAVVKRFLTPQKEALTSLLMTTRTGFTEDQNYELREQLDRMTRYLEDLELVRERALVLQEEMTNFSMEQQNMRMYALSIVAAVFLPITFVSGVFGMNVAGLPGTDEPAAFLFVGGTMFVMTLLVLGYFKWSRWL